MTNQSYMIAWRFNGSPCQLGIESCAKFTLELISLFISKEFDRGLLSGIMSLPIATALVLQMPVSSMSFFEEYQPFPE